jgi:hypothetical protein
MEGCDCNDRILDGFPMQSGLDYHRPSAPIPAVYNEMTV